MSQVTYTPASPYPATGEVLDGKYRVEQMLGEGGMGAVAKATHLLRRAPVALKFMSPAVLAMQGAIERFVNEGVAASRINSDHVVKIFDVGRLPSGAPYLVMEFLDGCDLGQLLTRTGGHLDTTRVVHFALQILRALQTAHAAGIVHRDMKPSNCFVIEKDGEPDFVKLVDFGISKVRLNDAEGEAGQRANLTRTNSALGTPLYMSPEQARSPKDVDPRADLYSVGAIMYELLTGRTPYTCESGEYTEILFKIFTTDPTPVQSLRPDIPDGLAATIHRALLRDPNLRFSSASEMAEALVPYADERSAQTITRLYGGRGRSSPPVAPPSGTFPPPSLSAAPIPSGPPRMPAGGGPPVSTYPYPHAVPSARVATDVGVTREASGGSSRGGRIALVAGLGVLVVVLGGAAGVVMLRRMSAGSHVVLTDEPPAVSTASHAVSTAPPVTPRPSAPPALPSAAPTPSAQLEPLPSASTASSASLATPTTLPSQGPRPYPSGGTLVGVQPHF